MKDERRGTINWVHVGGSGLDSGAASFAGLSALESWE